MFLFLFFFSLVVYSDSYRNAHTLTCVCKPRKRKVITQITRWTMNIFADSLPLESARENIVKRRS